VHDVVSVIGGSAAPDGLLEAAERLGRLLAEAGYTVLCGGGSGIMEYVCRGAGQAGGITVGILPGERREGANPWIDIPVPTGMSSARNRIVALSGLAVVAVGGRYGTLSEIAFALDAGRPVCSLGGWTGIPGVVEVSSPEEALEFVDSIIRTGGNAQG
jgi:uncharacterized protein (TIGR00725 family)